MANFLLVNLVVLLFTNSLSDKTIPVYKFDQFKHYLDYKNDTTYVINFWATWCVPCRKELPDFEKLNSTYSKQAVKVLLVSLDESENMDKSLIPFIEKYQLKSKIVVLDDPNSNYWINQINPSWNGTIPATHDLQLQKRVQ
ncbi:MAG: TlpA family protein disulfide reductase, partial [Bacteroidales bacterium]|nr:TlpA family protein disulfide reductase [Bacteroidales bacterium]